jgi:hypothetical protein
MTGERRRPPTPIDKSPTLGHCHRISVATTNVVVRRMRLVGENVEEDGLLCIVVVKRGGCRRPTTGACARTSHGLTLSPGTFRRRDHRPIASPPWRSPRRTQTIRRVRNDRPRPHERTGLLEKLAARKVESQLRPILRSDHEDSLLHVQHHRPVQQRAHHRLSSKLLARQALRAGVMRNRRQRRRSMPTVPAL